MRDRKSRSTGNLLPEGNIGLYLTHDMVTAGRARRFNQPTLPDTSFEADDPRPGGWDVLVPGAALARQRRKYRFEVIYSAGKMVESEPASREDVLLIEEHLGGL